jgi:predicted DsbA family dithiol-disulfide isomerase
LTLRIDIFADLVCPWCFIGKRRLERALAMRPDLAAARTWRPYQLNPDLPPGGVAAAEFWAEKFGAPALIAERRGMVREAGASVGIDFAFERMTREPNTLDAHRLVRFAAARAAADAVVDALFAAHFLAGRDIGDRAVLAAIAGEIGLDRGAAAGFLAGDGEAATVLAAEAEARRLGVTAVPCYIFERHYAVAGAQEPEFFLPIFDLVQGGSVQDGATAAGST